MLRPEQISNANFTPVSAGAYSSEEVDNFLGSVAETYEQVLKEKNDLIKKMSILADKVESYRKDEEAIKLALLDARRAAENVTKDANAKAAVLLSSAKTQADSVTSDANAEAAKVLDDARAQAKSIVDNARVAVTSLTERAQQETNRAITNAQEKAAEIIADAKKQGETIIGNSKNEYDYYTAELKKVKSESAEFKAAIENLCNGQLNLISGIPAFVASVSEQDAAPEAVPEEAAAPEEAVVPEPEIIEAPVFEIPEVELEEKTDADITAEPEIPAPEFEIEPEEAEEELPSFEFEEVSASEDGAVQIDDNADIDELLGLFGDAPAETVDFASDIDDMLPEIPSFEDIVGETAAPAEAEPETAAAEEDAGIEDDFVLDLEPIDDSASEDDEDITSLFDSLFNE